MSLGVEAQFFEKLERAPIVPAPFPHFFLENVFSDDLYSQMLGKLPANDELVPIGETGLVTPGAYPERSILRLGGLDSKRLEEPRREFWEGVAANFLGARLTSLMAERFWPYVLERFGENLLKIRVAEQVKLVRDQTRYMLGPHTDAPHRLLTMLFYLPADAGKTHLGTVLYEPKDKSFRCKGGPHHPRELFDAVKSIPYRPNSVIAFLRTDNSFHGVEPVTDQDAQRDILAYQVRIKGITFEKPPAGDVAQAGEAAQPAP